LLLCQGGARFECVEDDACELAFEAADRFASALAFGLLALEVGACAWMHTGLCDRDAVEGRVELAVTAAVEPVALHAARARFERRDAAVTGELRVGAEAVDRPDLGEQLRCGERSAAGQLE
jgi:hypothetical protein